MTVFVLREKTASEWSKLYGAQLSEYLGKNCLSPEDMNCSGCQSRSGLFIGCMNCPIRTCAQENLDRIRAIEDVS